MNNEEQNARPEISAKQLSEVLGRGENIVLVDVREPQEWAIGHIEGAVLISLDELPTRWVELDQSLEIVTICHRGIRSMHALEFLKTSGFDRVQSLAGGMDAWSTDVDDTVPRY